MGKILRPSTLRMPFDSGGNLKPDFDPNYPDFNAPDLKTLPWERDMNNAWTTPEFRALVLAWLASFFIAEGSWAQRWSARERRQLPGQSATPMPEPILSIVITRKPDGRQFESIMDATFEEMHDTVIVNRRLSMVGSLLIQQHIDNPVT